MGRMMAMIFDGEAVNAEVEVWAVVTGHKVLTWVF
jgi:hypothetical protein